MKELLFTALCSITRYYHLLGTFGTKLKTSRQRRVAFVQLWFDETEPGFLRFPQMREEQNWSEACSHPAAREKTHTVLPSSFLLWRLSGTLTPASFAPHPLTPGYIQPGKSRNPSWHLWYFSGLLIVKEWTSCQQTDKPDNTPQQRREMSCWVLSRHAELDASHSNASWRGGQIFGSRFSCKCRLSVSPWT